MLIVQDLALGERRVAETLPFLDELAHRGVNDIGIGFYMALPGTELFRSLYDAGRIKIDRRYFRHILDALAPIPSQTYCDSLSRLDLVFWKIRMFRRFYGGVQKNGERGLVGALRRAASGLFGNEDHESKLQTAVRNGVTIAIRTVLVNFGPRYMKKTDEYAMFATWDDLYRGIQKQKFEAGAVDRMPSDTTMLHQTNVIPTLLKEHSTARTITSVAG